MGIVRHHPRPRHEIGPLLLKLLGPLLRYSWGRDAYILRGIGETRGPVFVKRDDD